MKLRKILCVLCACMMLFSMTAGASYYTKVPQKTGGFYMDFESSADGEVCASNYTLLKGEGAGGSEGYAKVSLNSGGAISVYSNFVEANGAYRVSYKTKSENEYSARIRLFYNGPVYTVTEAPEGSEYAVGDTYNGSNFRREISVTIPAGNDWVENTENFTTVGDGFSITVDDLGTKAELSGYASLGINFYRNESDAFFCIDDVCLESVSSEYVPADLSYAGGNEMMGPKRTITSSGSLTYDAGAIGTDNAYAIYIDGAEQTKLGGHFINTSDAADDKVLFGYNAKADTASFGFVAGADSYGQTNIKPYVKYRFAVRAKAPAYVVDNTVEAENAIYVDSTTGEVKVKGESVTNGMIGAELSFGWSHNGAANKKNYAFTGYLDDNGDYVSFDNPDAEYKSAVLTTDWVYYVGFFTNSSTLGTPRNYVDAKGTSEGAWYIDNVSIKEAKNAFPDGEFESKSLYVPSADVNADAEFVTVDGNTDLKWVQGAENKSINAYAILTPSATYRLKIRAKVEDASAVGAKMHIKTTLGGRFVTFTPNSGTELTDEYTEYEYVATLGAYAYNRLVISVDTTALENAPTSHNVLIDYIYLEEMDTIAIENIALNSSLDAGEEANFTWKTSSTSKNAMVKVYQTDGTNEGMIGAYSVRSDSVSFTLPVNSVGKMIKVQVISLDESKNPVSYKTYTTNETVSGLAIVNAEADSENFKANVVNSGGYSGFAIVATYTEEGRLLTCEDFVLNNSLTPVSVAKGDAAYAKVMIFDGVGFGDTNLIPLCNCTEIR